MERGGPGSATAVSLRLCSYYPLYPPQEDMAIDYESFYTYAQLSVTPDVFIIPSELKYFVKVGLKSVLSQKRQNLSDFSLLDHWSSLLILGMMASFLWER